MRFTIRWLFAALAVVCGVYVLAQAAGNHVAIATGLGLIFAGLATVTP